MCPPITIFKRNIFYWCLCLVCHVREAHFGLWLRMSSTVGRWVPQEEHCYLGRRRNAEVSRRQSFDQKVVDRSSPINKTSRCRDTHPTSRSAYRRSSWDERTARFRIASVGDAAPAPTLRVNQGRPNPWDALVILAGQAQDSESTIYEIVLSELSLPTGDIQASPIPIDMNFGELCIMCTTHLLFPRPYHAWFQLDGAQQMPGLFDALLELWSMNGVSSSNMQITYIGFGAVEYRETYR